MPEVELNSALRKFYDFAKDGYEFGNRNEVSNVTIGKNGHVCVSASATDYRLKGWRSDSEKCANNVARLEFFKAVVAQFGSFDRIPEGVLRAMKLLDYGDRAGMRELERTVEGKRDGRNPQADYAHAGSGKPLVARRILDVIEAIQKSPEALVNTIAKKLNKILESNEELGDKATIAKTYLRRVFNTAFSPVVFADEAFQTLHENRKEMMKHWLSAFEAECRCANSKFSKGSAKYQFCEDVIANVQQYLRELDHGELDGNLLKDHDIKGKSYAELEGASWARRMGAEKKSLSELHQKFVKDFLRAEGDDFVKGGSSRAIGRILQCERKLGNAADNETLVQAMQRLRADYEKCLEEFVPGTDGWQKFNDFLKGLFKDIPEVKQQSTLLEEEGVKAEPRKVVAKKNLLIELESVQEEEEIPKHPNKAPLIDAEAVEGRRFVTNYGVIWDKSKSLFNEMVLESEGGVPVIRALDDRNLDDRYIIKKNLDVVEARFSLIKEIVSTLFGSEEQVDEGQVNNFVAELCLELSQERIQNDKVQFFLQVSAVVDKLKAKMEQMPEGAAKIKCAAGIDAFAGAFDAFTQDEGWNLSAEDYGRIFAGRYERNVKTQEDCRKFLTNHFELLLPRYGFSLKGETELNNKLQDVVAGLFQAGKPFGEAIEKLKGYFADCAKATIADPELREQKIDMFNAFLKGIRPRQEVVVENDDSSDVSLELLREEDGTFGENNVQEEQPRQEAAGNRRNPEAQEYFTIPRNSVDEGNNVQEQSRQMEPPRQQEQPRQMEQPRQQEQPRQMEQPGGTGAAGLDRPNANVPAKTAEEIEGENLANELQGVRGINRKRGMVRTHMNEFVEQKLRMNIQWMRQQFLALSFEELEFGEMMKKYHEIMRQSIRELPLEESEKRERLANFIKGYFKDFPLDD